VLLKRNIPIDGKQLATICEEYFFFQLHCTGATIASPYHVYSISVLCTASGKLELKYYLWGDIYPGLPVSYFSHLILHGREANGMMWKQGKGNEKKSCPSKY
jgi:hypothetical protein